MKSVFTDMLTVAPTLTNSSLVNEAYKVLIVLGLDQSVNLDIEDRIKLTNKFEFSSYTSCSYLTLEALVPAYAIKSNSLLLKHRENPSILSKQRQHAQKLYKQASKLVNSYPYGEVIFYDFEPWTDGNLRIYFLLKYGKDFVGNNNL